MRAACKIFGGEEATASTALRQTLDKILNRYKSEESDRFTYAETKVALGEVQTLVKAMLLIERSKGIYPEAERLVDYADPQAKIINCPFEQDAKSWSLRILARTEPGQKGESRIGISLYDEQGRTLSIRHDLQRVNGKSAFDVDGTAINLACGPLKDPKGNALKSGTIPDHHYVEKSVRFVAFHGRVVKFAKNYVDPQLTQLETRVAVAARKSSSRTSRIDSIYGRVAADGLVRFQDTIIQMAPAAGTAFFPARFMLESAIESTTERLLEQVERGRVSPVNATLVLDDLKNQCDALARVGRGDLRVLKVSRKNSVHPVRDGVVVVQGQPSPYLHIDGRLNGDPRMTFLLGAAETPAPRDLQFQIVRSDATNEVAVHFSSDRLRSFALGEAPDGNCVWKGKATGTLATRAGFFDAIREYFDNLYSLHAWEKKRVNEGWESA